MLTDHLPRIPLGQLPTPLEELPRLSRALEGPRLLIKRDDQTGLAGGGNKTRKLEFSVAEAVRQGADTLITMGGVQSNHCRQTAAAAASCGQRGIAFSPKARLASSFTNVIEVPAPALSPSSAMGRDGCFPGTRSVASRRCMPRSARRGSNPTFRRSRSKTAS